MSSPASRKGRIRFLFEYSVFLLAGTFLALIVANVPALGLFERYQQFVEWQPLSLFAGHTVEHEGHGHTWNIHFIVNDLFMAFFFAVAGKEVWEALLPGGKLNPLRKAIVPLAATAGGVIAPAGIYAIGVLWIGQWDVLGRGWAIPCATDIAFSYLFARLIFGAGHPAIIFLLLLAIADDAAGLVILAVWYPSGEQQLLWLLLTVGAMVLGFVMHKVLRVRRWYWYLLIPGTLSWVSLYLANIHPALGLLPIIPVMPHAHTDLGLFAREEEGRHDALNEFEHAIKDPVDIMLGLFGFVNAGVVFSSMGHGTTLVLMGLLVGKPLGILLCTWLVVRGLKFDMPAGMNYRHVVVLGSIAGIGFTVSLFISVAAFPEPGLAQSSVKMGSLFSFASAGIAFLLARALSISRASAPVTEAEAILETSPSPAEA